MKTTLVLAVMLVAGATLAMPSAAAAECDPSNFDEVQKCEQAVEEGVQTVLIVVGDAYCNFAGC